MHHCRTAVLVIALAAAFAPARADGHDVTPEDYFTLNAITGFAVAPDGKSVAYTEARWEATDDARKTDLWTVGIDTQPRPVRLTFDRANDRNPKWAGDGKAVYVLANRKREGEKKPPYDGTTQVWRVPVDGGAPRAVTRVEGGIVAYDYSPKTESLFYATDSTAPDTDEFAKLRAKFDKVEYGSGNRKVSEIHRLNLETWRTEKVIAENRYVREFDATADGSRVAMITAPDDTVVVSEGQSRVDVWDSSTNKVTTTDESWKKTAGSKYPWLEGLAWNLAGTRLAFCTVFDGYPAEVIIEDQDKGPWTATRVKRPEGVQIRGYGSPLRWLDDRALAYLGEKHGTVDVYGFGVNSHDTTGIPRPGVVVSMFEVTPTGGAITFEATGASFPDLRERGPDGKKITDLNPHTKDWQIPSVKHVTWKAPDGATVGGVLELPPGYKKGTKLPLVVGIHGGPTSSSKAELIFDPHNGRLYFAARGYAALYPNYRGSVGYGDKFLTDLIGNENDLDVKDILAGIDHLVTEGIADPDRVAVMGWSNGGYLTNCLITLKDPPVKFKAASSGAGIVDTVAEWGFNDEPAYALVFKRGLPWEQPDLYHKTSPTYGLGNVTTPTLIHVGGGDERCPPGHSRMLHRALKEYKKVPTELVVYSGEPHGLTKMTNRKAKMEWDLAWFDKYVLGKK
ncbi:alpha/beta hydrolase family protein [Fimbriiglobus ruber]|uniref:Prolyl oligopeptidase family (Peptidase S9) n=1 Tax=Fimbriiglobus ruber TaxID=1908690 RepID=A0A225DPJ3_9BACT|nr:S9 family peptidase [Fimbriiglobus ruber]OWK38087.1 Prolyl oligopeptidase family (Peptidase S9) [Fimbriiglobus ruber]